jgi:aldehyde dehydrogenase (NAD+)
MTETHRMLIGGQWTDAASGKTFQTIDPSTGEAFAEVAAAGPDDGARAVRAAREAFDRGPWPRMPGAERAEHLRKVAELAKQNAGRLAELEIQDAGHTVRVAKNADVGMVISTFRVFADIAAKEEDEEPLSVNQASRNYIRREPIGVCVGITPWNFPMQMAAWKIAPAIAAGNTMVLKPPTYASLTSLEIGRLCLEAGIPDGVVNVVPGSGATAGEALVSSPLVDKVAFTGSTEVGRRIMQLASGNVKKTTLELGGKSAMIVLEDADLEYALDGALWTAFFHSGQVCSAGTRLLLPQSLHDEFVAELAKRASAFRVGPAADMSSDLGPVISQTQLETVERYVAIGREEGADVLTGGERAFVEGHDGGFYHQPTIFTGVRNSMRIAQVEIFGPVLVAIPYKDEDEAVAIANDSVYGLAGGVWSSDFDHAIRVAHRLRTGTVWINDHHMINPRFPFGGYKQSGLGREHGEVGYNEYREVKHVHVDLLGQDRSKHPWWDLAVPRREPPQPPRPGSGEAVPGG